MRTWKIVVAGLLVVGCGSAARNHQPKEAPPTSAGVDCASRSDQLKQALQDLGNRGPGFLPIQRDIRAPESSGGKPITERGTIIAITRDGRALGKGMELSNSDAVFEYLRQVNDATREAIALRGGDPHTTKNLIYLWADRDVPTDKVAGVLEAAAKSSDRWKFRLLVAGGSSDVPPPPVASVAAIAAKLPSTEPDGTVYLSQQLRASTESEACKPVIMALAANSGLAIPEEQAGKLASEVHASLRECACKVADLDLFEWAMKEWFGASAPTLMWIDVPAIAKGTSQPISLLVK